MPSELKLWQVDNERLISIHQQKLDSEARLEKRIRDDVGLISSDLLIIGQQVQTAYGGIIDLLAVDPDGNTVILELKRDKTPRDIVAQILDYASWVEHLNHEAIIDIGNNYFSNIKLDQAFQDKFGKSLPDILNERHRMYIVSSSLDPSTERIVKYLSENYNVDINVATLTYYYTSNSEILGRFFLLDEEQVQIRAESTSKRQPSKTIEEFRGIAEVNCVLDLFDTAIRDLRPLVDTMGRTVTNVALIGYKGEEKARRTLIGIYPGESSKDTGLAIMFHYDHLYEYYDISYDDLQILLKKPAINVTTYDPSKTFYFDAELLQDLITLLSEAKQKINQNNK